MTATNALNNVTLQYTGALAKKGWKKACEENKALKKGLNMANGKIMYKAVADSFDLPFYENVE